MRLTTADIDAIADAVAKRLRSGGPSSTETGALGQETQCNDNDRKQFMDPTNTETSGESSSAEQIAARLLSRSRQKQKPNVSRLQHARKARAAR